jgi:hypothetical protein
MPRTETDIHPENQELITQLIRQDIADPINQLDAMSRSYGNQEEIPGTERVFAGLDLPGITALFNIYTTEIRNAAENGIGFIDKFDGITQGIPEDESTFQHELRHLEKAAELGVDIRKFKITLAFVRHISDGKLGMIMNISQPGLSKFTMVQIRLAPVYPSLSDISRAMDDLEELNPDEVDYIYKSYKAKLPFDIRIYK